MFTTHDKFAMLQSTRSRLKFYVAAEGVEDNGAVENVKFAVSVQKPQNI